MAKISWLGATYTDVPAVSFPDGDGGESVFYENSPGAVVVTEEPDTGGGTAVNITAVDISGDTVDAAHLLSGYTAHDKYGNSITGSAPSGASNVVTGTFTGTTTGSVLEIDIPYAGSGWPIGFMIFPSAGVRNPGSVFNDAVQRYACQLFCVGKSRADRSQTTAETESDNKAYSHGVNRYKSSSTYNTQYAVTAIENYPTFWDAAANSNVSGIARMRTTTKLSVFIASSSYGFMANVEYTYVIVYSS